MQLLLDTVIYGESICTIWFNLKWPYIVSDFKVFLSCKGADLSHMFSLNTNKKSYMGIQLHLYVWPWMVNGNAPYVLKGYMS